MLQLLGNAKHVSPHLEMSWRGSCLSKNQLIEIQLEVLPEALNEPLLFPVCRGLCWPFQSSGLTERTLYTGTPQLWLR